jgi:hypothetical protein
MSSLCHYPQTSACNADTEPDRLDRLHEAFGIMCSIARMIWREEPGWISRSEDPDRVRWDGSIVSLRDTKGLLEVTWCGAQHRERYGVLAELAWEAMSESRSNVTHKVVGPFS